MSGAGPMPGPICYTPIGIIYSEHYVPENTPVQPVYADGCTGRVELRSEYAEGLKDIEGFSHLILLYHFHQAGNARLTVQPFTDNIPRGVFATRHPQRPNPIGISVVRLVRVEGTTIYLEGVDILDGSPLLDIKPYIPRFDRVENPRGGWTEQVDEETARQRGRRGFRGRGKS